MPAAAFRIGRRAAYGHDLLQEAQRQGGSVLSVRAFDFRPAIDRSADTVPCCGAWDLQSRTSHAPDIPGRTAAAGRTRSR